tara:strand:- start:31629 stop:32474 length:846 start_codon:yes stop_codon:yes gene_type:complete
MSSDALREYVPWENHHETIFVDWADKAACYKWMHNKSYIKYSSKRNMYTIPVIIMSTLTGTANFALERIPAEYQDTASVVIGSVNILAGIITTVAQFLKLNELTESHRTASIAWDKFHRSIRIELIKSPEERPDINYFIKTARDEYDRLMETCPQIDKDIVEMFRKKLTTGIDKNDVVRKLKSFNRLIKPELFNEISSLKDVVFKRSTKRLDIEQGDRSRIEKLIIERDNYRQNYNKVYEFVTNFREKYSRRPSNEEIISNVTEIELPEINMIINELHLDP